MKCFLMTRRDQTVGEKGLLVELSYLIHVSILFEREGELEFIYFDYTLQK